MIKINQLEETEAEERYCQGYNCGDPLEDDDDELCKECYKKESARIYDERKHPDDCANRLNRQRGAGKWINISE